MLILPKLIYRVHAITIKTPVWDCTCGEGIYYKDTTLCYDCSISYFGGEYITMHFSNLIELYITKSEHISQLCLLRGTRRSDTQSAMSTPRAQIFISNIPQSKEPGLLGEVSDFRAGTGKIQGAWIILLCKKSNKVLRKTKDRAMSKGHRRWHKRAFNGQNLDNLSNKLSNDSVGL